MAVVVLAQLGLVSGETPGVLVADGVDQIHELNQILLLFGVDEDQQGADVQGAAAGEVGLLVLVAVTVVVEAAVGRIIQGRDGVPPLLLPFLEQALPQGAVHVTFTDLCPEGGVVGLTQQLFHGWNLLFVGFLHYTTKKRGLASAF